MNAPERVLAAGAWDIHVHAAPSLFERWGDGWDLAVACRDAHMAGVVLKAHEGSTVEVARLLDARFEGIAVHGGVVLNHFVGGISPLVVEQSLALGGSIVWLPTIHAAHHGEVLGQLGAFSFQGRPLVHTPRIGYSVITSEGDVRDEVREVLALLHDTGVVLGTGHVSPREIVALCEARVRDRRRVRILVNHAFFTVPALTHTDLAELMGPDVYFEICDLSTSPLTRATTPAHVAKHVKAFPGAHWILASDSGQKDNVPAPAALERYGRALLEEGIAASQVERMMRETPATLLSR
jgi:hypothetical protein